MTLENFFRKLLRSVKSAINLKELKTVASVREQKIVKVDKINE